MSEKTKTIAPGITQEMIDAGIAKGLKVRLAEVPIDDEGTTKTVLVCVPSRTILSQFRKYMDSDPKKADEILVKNCVLSHKDEILADDELFGSVLTTIADLIVVRKGVIKNL